MLERMMSGLSVFNKPHGSFFSLDEKNMGKICYRLVYNREKHLNLNGKALVQIEAYQDGRRVYFSTHIYLTPKQWNVRKRLVIHHPEADSLNYMLQELVINMEHKEMDLWRRGQSVTLDTLKQALKTNGRKAFIQFVEDEVSSSTKKKSTRYNLMSTLKLLSQFKPKLDFDDVNSRFVYKFEEFLYHKGCCTNTVAKHMKHLRTFVNSAIDKGYMKAEEYAFQRYKIRTKESKHTYLMAEEMQKLENLDMSDNIPLKHSLDAFLFCCYTGLRYSDFVVLTENNIVLIDNNPWIVFRSVKTNVEVKLPLHLLFEGKAWKLLYRYKGNWNSFFTLKSNSCINYDLKKIAKLADIKKHFTFHSSRHTNATLLIYEGVNITTVQKLLGHRNISTTQIYSEIMKETIVKDLVRCSNKT